MRATGVIGVRRAWRGIDDEAIEVAPMPAHEALLLGGARWRNRWQRGAACNKHGEQKEGAHAFQKLIVRLLVTRKSVST